MQKFDLKWSMKINSRSVPSNDVIGFSGLSSLSCLAFERENVRREEKILTVFLMTLRQECIADGKEKNSDPSQVLPLPCHCEGI